MDFYNQDGLTDSLYFYLWDRAKSSDRPLKPFLINVPNTIIFRNREPAGTQSISQSNYQLGFSPIRKANMSKNMIRIVLGIRQQNSTKIKNQNRESLPISLKNYQTLNQNYYITILMSFKPDEGILQQFLEINGDKNSTQKINQELGLIQVIWSPNLTLFQKRQSKKALYQLQYDPYERCCTFDGPIYLSEQVTMPMNSSSKIRQIMQSIAYVNQVRLIKFQRIQDASQNQFTVIRACAYFKQNKKGNYYLLFCTSLRIDSLFRNESDYFHQKARVFYNQKQKIMPLKLNVPIQSQDNIELLMNKSSGKPQQLHKREKCLNCNRIYHESDFLQLSFDQLIKSYQDAHYKDLPSQKKYSNFQEINFARNPICETQYTQASNKLNIQSCQLVKGNFYLKIQKQEVQTNENKRRQKELENNLLVNPEPLIPPLIQKLYPRLHQEEFKKLKSNPKFASRTFYICLQCYLSVVSQIDEIGGMNKYVDQKEILSKRLYSQDKVSKFYHINRARRQHSDHRISLGEERKIENQSSQRVQTSVKRVSINNSTEVGTSERIRSISLKKINQKYIDFTDDIFY